MFGKLFGGSTERPEVAPHALPAPRRRRNGTYPLHALGDTRVLALLEAAGAGDWPAVKAALAPFDIGRDHHVLRELANVDGVQDWIGRAVDEDEEDRATALLISGARHIVWGWQARTTKLAVDVSPEQWRVFHDRLRIAEEQLLEAIELRLEWVTPWVRLLTLGRGMSLGTDVNEAWLEGALSRDPLDLEAHLEWLSHLLPRWGGAPGEALPFARAALARAPRGHRLGCVIAMAYVNVWADADRADCLETPEIRAELRAAADHSILDPAYAFAPGWQYDFNLFAMALAMAEENHTVRRVFRTLDGAYTGWPWHHYLAKPEKVFARYHRRA
ncbi:hypothetical protein H8N01_30135 [Streptomyces sp. AC536]|uniref:hypothetical protein n=1 Tax=Streptomyces buecherae TaxID=2763006 RepID=UPI00164DF12B|nr:hypothetical protein [Streptomyces buecherae]MBC3986726.1 hypothetical protein [Streptomyces buecherae]QNJ43653.1 hypothetical protein H7H31_31215 [Streptomyces buecherae]